MRKEDVDYSLYLVTDSTPGILGNQDLCQVVEAAIKGGVSCVQYRDKLNDTAVLVSTGRKLHEITSRYRVPLLINDRVDVALAIGCEGVHLGQDDLGEILSQRGLEIGRRRLLTGWLDLRIARALLGPDAIIGASASSVEEVETACEQEADYLGIGTVFATPTCAPRPMSERRLALRIARLTRLQEREFEEHHRRRRPTTAFGAHLEAEIARPNRLHRRH